MFFAVKRLDKTLESAKAESDTVGPKAWSPKADFSTPVGKTVRGKDGKFAKKFPPVEIHTN